MRTPGIRVWLALVGTVVASVFLNVLISINLANRAAAAQNEVACEIARTQSDVYRSSPPSTATGRTAALAWENARTRWCKE